MNSLKLLSTFVHFFFFCSFFDSLSRRGFELSCSLKCEQKFLTLLFAKGTYHSLSRCHPSPLHLKTPLFKDQRSKFKTILSLLFVSLLKPSRSSSNHSLTYSQFDALHSSSSVLALWVVSSSDIYGRIDQFRS